MKRFTFVRHGRREVASLKDVDIEHGVCLGMFDNGQTILLNLWEIEQPKILADALKLWYEHREQIREAQEREALMRAYEQDRDQGTGQDAPLPD